MLIWARVHPNVARSELDRASGTGMDISLLFSGYTITCFLETTLYLCGVTECSKSMEDNSEISSHTCLLLPHHTDVSWLKNALKVDQSFFCIKVITEFESQVQNARVTETDRLRKCKYSIIYEWSAMF